MSVEQLKERREMGREVIVALCFLLVVVSTMALIAALSLVVMVLVT